MPFMFLTSFSLPLQVQPLARRLTLGIICSVIFGPEAACIVEALAADFQLLGDAILSFPVNIPFTRFGKGMRSSAKIRKAITAIAHKKEESLLNEKHVSSTDFITYMLILRSQGAHSLTIEDIVNNVMGLIIGAHGTTSALITFMIRHLANEPDVLAKICEGKCHCSTMLCLQFRNYCPTLPFDKKIDNCLIIPSCVYM